MREKNIKGLLVKFLVYILSIGIYVTHGVKGTDGTDGTVVSVHSNITLKNKIIMVHGTSDNISPYDIRNNRYLCRLLMEGEKLKDYEELMDTQSGTSQSGMSQQSGASRPGGGGTGPGDLSPRGEGTSLGGLSSLIGGLTSLAGSGGRVDPEVITNPVITIAATDPTPVPVPFSVPTVPTVPTVPGRRGDSVSSDTGTTSTEFEGNCIGPMYQRCKSARATSLISLAPLLRRVPDWVKPYQLQSPGWEHWSKGTNGWPKRFGDRESHQTG